MADITGQLDTVLKAAGHTNGTVGERLSALNRASDQLYPDTAQGRTDLIAGLNKSVATMREKLPRAFADIPNDPLVIRAVPTDIQDGAPNGYYNSAPLDGSRPAIYWINLKSVNDWPKYTLPSLTYHEGIPGHHLQGGYAQGGGELPWILRDYFISAYGEGWALYAEQLGDELGGYNCIERADYLQSCLFRAVRLVVDTGIHHYRGSREKATAYMVEKTGFTQARSQREIERYCTMIGQACSYKIGHTAWVANRKKAQAALGDSVRDAQAKAYAGVARVSWANEFHRTDIGWHTSIAFRLREKARRLGTYRASLAGLAPDHALIATLDAAQIHASDMAELFSRPLDTPEALAAAANRMTADDPAKLLSLTPLIEAGDLVQLTDAEIAAPQSFFVTWSARRPLSRQGCILRDWLLSLHD